MKSAQTSRNTLTAFTVAELLVITGVMSVLTVLMLPSLDDAKANVRTAFCLNNLKQWGVGFQLYAADWSGYLPSEGSLQAIAAKECWYNAVPPYLKMSSYKDLPGVGSSIQPFGKLRIWVCPEKNLRNAKTASGKNSVFYGMNGYLDDNNFDDLPHHVLQHVRLSTVTDPNATILLCDVKASQVYCDPMDTTFQTYPWQQNGEGLHQNGANFLFVDGHVTWFPVSAYWDGSNGITNNPSLRWYP